MSRHKITLLSVSAAVLLAAVLMASVWLTYFIGRGADIQLPPILPAGPSLDATSPGPSPNVLPYAPLVPDAGNVQTLLAAVERPDSYTQEAECVTYWPGGEERAVLFWARRGELTRVETRREGRQAQTRVVTPELIYVWTGSAPPVHEVPSEDADADELSGVPAWEDVAALPPESILSAEYLYLPVTAERCLRILTREAVYQGEYILSLETGLLISATFTGFDGQPAYEYRAKPPEPGGPEYFTLPDGRRLA